jgi:hypothetical protein
MPRVWLSDVVRAVGLEPTTYGLEDIKRDDDEIRQVTFISSQCGLSSVQIGSHLHASIQHYYTQTTPSLDPHSRVSVRVEGWRRYTSLRLVSSARSDVGLGRKTT